MEFQCSMRILWWWHYVGLNVFWQYVLKIFGFLKGTAALVFSNNLVPTLLHVEWK